MNDYIDLQFIKEGLGMLERECADLESDIRVWSAHINKYSKYDAQEIFSTISHEARCAISNTRNLVEDGESYASY